MVFNGEFRTLRYLLVHKRLANLTMDLVRDKKNEIDCENKQVKLRDLQLCTDILKER